MCVCVCVCRGWGPGLVGSFWRRGKEGIPDGASRCWGHTQVCRVGVAGSQGGLDPAHLPGLLKLPRLILKC